MALISSCLTLDPKKVLEEINEIVKGDIPTAQEIHKLEYTKRMFTEVLRLHPSVPVDGREVVEEDTLPSGHIVRPGILLTFFSKQSNFPN